MSTDFKMFAEIRACDLFDGRLWKHNVLEHVHVDTTANWRCLSDGSNYLWLIIGSDGCVACFTCYEGAPGKILRSIADAFDTGFVSEHQRQFWRNAARQESDAFMHDLDECYKDEFYKKIIKHLRGEESEFVPGKMGTVGMKRARIAEQLVAKNPDLLFPQNKDRLIKEIDEEDDRQSPWIALSDEDIAAAEMMATTVYRKHQP